MEVRNKSNWKIMFKVVVLTLCLFSLVLLIASRFKRQSLLYSVGIYSLCGAAILEAVKNFRCKKYGTALLELCVAVLWFLYVFLGE